VSRLIQLCETTAGIDHGQAEFSAASSGFSAAGNITVMATARIAAIPAFTNIFVFASFLRS
jgi:hypothetical protein